MKIELPVGAGTIYTEKNGQYTASFISLNKGKNASKISLHWLNKMQSKFMKNGIIIPIHCQTNGGEKQIKNYSLDGYVEFDNKKIGLDFRKVQNFSYTQKKVSQSKDYFLSLKEDVDFIPVIFVVRNILEL